MSEATLCAEIAARLSPIYCDSQWTEAVLLALFCPSLAGVDGKYKCNETKQVTKALVRFDGIRQARLRRRLQP